MIIPWDFPCQLELLRARKIVLTALNSHGYQQLPLIPVENFLQQRPQLADADEKTLMFARINHELSEREALEQARQGLLKTKQSLIAENKKRKEDLASLDKDLETFIDVSWVLMATRWPRMLTLRRRRNRFKRFSKSSMFHGSKVNPIIAGRRHSYVPHRIYLRSIPLSTHGHKLPSHQFAESDGNISRSTDPLNVSAFQVEKLTNPVAITLRLHHH